MANQRNRASGDALVLNEDGTVTIGWGTVSATLREPTVGEWLSFMRESEAADAWSRTTDETVDGDETKPEPKGRTLAEAMDGGPYLALYQRLLSELGDTKVETDDMPPWLATGDTMRRISAWWSSSPLSRADQVAVTRTLSR